MSEFTELHKLMEKLNCSTMSVRCAMGTYTVWVEAHGKYVSRHNEYRLDTALSLVLQDLRDMANE